MLPSACGLGQHFQDLGHSFSLYGPPSRQITYIYFPGHDVISCQEVALSGFNSLIKRVSLILHCKSDFPEARKTEHFKALTQGCHASALADHVISTGHKNKWDHFDILATGKSDLQCKIKETLLISVLKPSLNENVGSEKLFLC